MNESSPPSSTPPPLTLVEKPAIAGKWMLWIIAAAVLPGLTFVVVENKGSEGIAPVFMLAGLLGQLVMSILLGIALSKRLGKGGGMAVLLVFVLLASSVAVGCCSAAAGCAMAGTKVDFK